MATLIILVAVGIGVLIWTNTTRGAGLKLEVQSGSPEQVRKSWETENPPAAGSGWTAYEVEPEQQK